MNGYNVQYRTIKDGKTIARFDSYVKATHENKAKQLMEERILELEKQDGVRRTIWGVLFLGPAIGEEKEKIVMITSNKPT